MDQFTDGMIARGPTLERDRETWTGSLHIVDLPSAEAARGFVDREPYNRAGLFEHHLIRRFRNLLGRTMWDTAEGSIGPRFLVIAHAGAGESAFASQLPDFTALPGKRLIVHGELLTPEDARPAGLVVALEAPTREAVEDLLSDGHGGLDERGYLEILDWEFGGRR